MHAIVYIGNLFRDVVGGATYLEFCNARNAGRSADVAADGAQEREPQVLVIVCKADLDLPVGTSTAWKHATRQLCFDFRIKSPFPAVSVMWEWPHEGTQAFR
jgi:hypothetical protein